MWGDAYDTTLWLETVTREVPYTDPDESRAMSTLAFELADGDVEAETFGE